jgi:hypothetical protein
LNRRIALERLSALTTAEQSEAVASRKIAVHDLDGQTLRGAPRRIFSGPGFHETP